MMITLRRFNFTTIKFISSLVVLGAFSLLAPSASLGQVFHLFGCNEGDPCDKDLTPLNDVIRVKDFDIGQGFSLSGELTYYRNVSPPGGISSNLHALGGVRITGDSTNAATITYSASAAGPVTTEFDFAFFEPSGVLIGGGGGPYTTIAAYKGSINATAAPGTRAFTLRTIANPTGNLPSAVAIPIGGGSSTGGPGVTQISGSGFATTPSISPFYSPPTSGDEGIFLIVGMTAFPGDVFRFPNSIEVGLFSVPEPTSLVQLVLGLSVLFFRFRRLG